MIWGCMYVIDGSLLHLLRLYGTEVIARRLYVSRRDILTAWYLNWDVHVSISGDISLLGGRGYVLYREL